MPFRPSFDIMKLMKKLNTISLTNEDISILNELSSGSTLQRRAFEIFKFLLLRTDFKAFVQNIRKKEGIPSQGVKLSDAKAWKEDKTARKYLNKGGYHSGSGIVSTNTISIPFKVRPEIEKYVAHINIEETIQPIGIFDNIIASIIFEYCLFNSVPLIGVDTITVSRADFDIFSEIQINVMVSITKEELIKAIEDNWGGIKSLKDELLSESTKGKVRHRLKSSKEFPRDIKIYNKYVELISTPKKERGFSYIDIEIAKEMKNDGNVTDEGNIRSIINRIKEQIKIANMQPPLF